MKTTIVLAGVRAAAAAELLVLTGRADAPAEVSAFGLLPLAGPVYWWSPAPALTR